MKTTTDFGSPFTVLFYAELSSVSAEMRFFEFGNRA
jgi:hypothetical protein